MAKILEKVADYKPLAESITELKSLVDFSGNYLEVLLEETEIYDQDPKFISRPDDAFRLVGSAIESTVEEFKEVIAKEVAALDEDKTDKVKEVITNIMKALSKERPIAFAYLAGILVNFTNPEINKVRKGKDYVVANIFLSNTDELRFLQACGLVEDRNRSGSTSHVKFIDPTGAMKGSFTTSTNGKAWLKNKIKTLLEEGLPLERVQAACQKCGYEFRLKVDKEDN